MNAQKTQGRKRQPQPSVESTKITPDRKRQPQSTPKQLESMTVRDKLDLIV
jgi:hypothetical protein